MTHTSRSPRADRKRRTILDAARELFLAQGYLGANMDAVAARAAVSKQTVYSHFGSKEALFVELVTDMTREAGDRVRAHDADGVSAGAAALLTAFAVEQLATVLRPDVLQLRRLVIGESTRFPDLGRALHEAGPKRAVDRIARVLDDLRSRGLVEFDDTTTAASTFNWLVMGGPLNDAMLLGDEAVPDAAAQRRHAEHAVRVFLAAHAPDRR
ncbi:TetR/AcrR family transcriptional regulator [Agromyces sp. ZXT2-6]|uniref:TetR/AcrR family transcriptional regulator n=1 Tax=Agromyces sp. ZXT2-6 TaxID=3461153 RepID=UPI004054F293